MVYTTNKYDVVSSIRGSVLYRFIFGHFLPVCALLPTATQPFLEPRFVPNFVPIFTTMNELDNERAHSLWYVHDLMQKI